MSRYKDWTENKRKSSNKFGPPTVLHDFCTIQLKVYRDEKFNMQKSINYE